MPVWKVKGQGKPVLEIWEDFNGNLYFITEHTNDDIKFGYVRLYHMPECAEWGSFSLDEIKLTWANRMPNGVWKVEEENWENITTYEEGLLVRVDE